MKKTVIMNYLVCLLLFTGIVDSATNEISITITNPQNGAQFESCVSTIDFTADITANAAEIQSVKFYRNDVYFGKARNSEAPFEVSWKNPFDGDFDIYAELTDTSGAIYLSDKIRITVGSVVEGNMIYNSEFNCDRITPWTFAAWGGSKASYVLDSTMDLSTPPAIFVEFEELPDPPQSWNVQLFQPIQVDSGVSYNISFRAEVMQEKVIYLGVQTNDGVVTTLWQAMTINESGLYSYVFDADQTMHENTKFLIALSEDDTPIAIDDVQFIASSASDVLEGNVHEHKLSYLLAQNYPNPFNPDTNIQFKISENAHVRIDIFNLKGQKVQTLINQNFIQGRHSVKWNGMDDFQNKVSSGVYFYQIQAEMESARLIHSQKMLLIN